MFIQKTISIYGTEIGLIAKLYSAFSEINGVTLTPTDYNGLFSDTSVAYSFTLEYRGLQIVFTRGNILTSDTTKLKVTVGNDSTVPEISWAWSGNSRKHNFEDTRELKFTFILSETAIEMFFANTNSDYISNNYCYLFIPYNNSYLYKVNTSVISTTAKSYTALNNSEFRKFGDNTTYKINQNLVYSVPYENNTYGVDILDFSILIGSTSYEKVDKINLLQCSNVPVNTKLTINNEDYWTVGSDVIVKI